MHFTLERSKSRFASAPRTSKWYFRCDSASATTGPDRLDASLASAAAARSCAASTSPAFTGATSTAFTGGCAAARGTSSAAGEGDATRGGWSRVFAVAAAPGRAGNVAPRAAANDAAVDSSLRSTCEDVAANAVDATRRVIARAGGAGGVAPVGAGAWSSRAVFPLSRSVRRDSMQRRRRGGTVFLWKRAGRTRDLSRGLFTSRGSVRRWGRFARVPIARGE